ncbi:Twinfilin actin binding protein 2 [Paragonimus heterotremus]|uniref:Twinfilin n=1 Tax=Paragonimus heterotremus TaxID=100268 RepID=A0A8J4WKW2_9TREM|nr:Twinfilin actin binding protein 2 [Paragonimus heterotremus]
MTHQSGIRADEHVAAQMVASQRNNVRALQVGIEEESLVIGAVEHIRSSWKNDYDRSILHLLDDSTPCYVFFKLDSVTEFGHDWLMINWVPEKATVRDKMLYASTKAAVRKQFGDHLIKEELNGNTVSDVSLRGFEQHLAAKAAPAPLTAAEREKAKILNNEMSGGFYDARQTVGSVSFELTEEAVLSLQEFLQGVLDYVQLMIDIEHEKITTACCCKRIEPHRIVQQTPENEGRYHVYRFKYEHGGRMNASLLFMHSISGYQSSVKSRMLYSSCKSSLLSQLERQFGLQFDHRLETDNMKELTAEYLLDILYPKPTEQKPKFEKPQGPSGRRPRTQLQ